MLMDAQSTRTRLPVEIYDAIAASCCREVLPIMAIVSRKFRVIAERHLYKDLVVQTFIQPVGGALETLESNAGKASYIRFLSVEFCSRALDNDLSMLNWIVRATPAMTNLRDLRIKLQPGMRTRFRKSVNELDSVLRGGDIQLETLVIDHFLHVRGIINAQRGLKVFGLYAAKGRNKPRPELTSLEGRSLLAFELNRDIHIPWGNRIALYPELLSSHQAMNFDSTFTRFSKSDAMTLTTMDCNRVVTVAVYFQGSPTETIFQAFIESMLKTFLKLNRIEFHLEPSMLCQWTQIPLNGSSVGLVELWMWDRATGRDLLHTTFAKYH